MVESSAKINQSQVNVKNEKQVFQQDSDNSLPMVDPTKRLKRAYILALSLVAVSLLIGQVLIQFTVKDLTEDSRIINIAGKQRMLSQKITKIALIYSNARHNEEILKELNSLFETFERVHYGLQNGDETIGIVEWENSPEVLVLFKELEPHFKGMKKGFEQIINKDKTRLSNNGNYVLLAHEGPFLKIMNSIAAAYEKESKERLSDLQKIEVVLMLLAFLVLGVEAIFIFIPSIRAIKHSFEEIKVKNIKIESKNQAIKKSYDKIITAEEELRQNVKEQFALNEKLAQTNVELEHSKALLELQQEELKKLSLVAEEVSNGVVITDKNGKVEWVNKGFTKTTGYSLNQVIGKKPGEFLQGPETSKEAIKTIREGLLSEKPFYAEILNYHKLGLPYWTDLHITPLHNENGNLNGFISVQSDVTERKNMEEKLKTSFSMLESKTKKITFSINYAKKIQNAFLPTQEKIKSLCDDFCVMYLPKDTVSGDFYWATKKKNKTFFAAVDCTGHGVPGALMSTIGNSLLNKIVEEHGISRPNRILEMLHRGINATLQQDKNGGQDGMDMVLCVIDREKREVNFAGAKNPILAVVDGEEVLLKGSRRPIGGRDSKFPFALNTFSYLNSVTLYLFTDGFQDQFGGRREDRRLLKIGRSRMRELLFGNAHLPLAQQGEKWNDFFAEWKGEEKQIDDVLLMGVKFDD